MPILSDGDIALVRDSFKQASAAPETLAAAFFRRMFELDRSLRRLFHGDMRQLGHKFVSTLGVLVTNLERFDDFAPTMRALGARHAGYHVRDEHYAIAGIALIGTLAGQLGDSFTPATRAAWTRVFGAITDEILSGARSAQVPPAAPAYPLPPSSTACTVPSNVATS
ncbi:MAG: hemin receptor [Opitutaceae bacterium]|nr:hemin receptor [Opitutaceae bacterium]